MTSAQHSAASVEHYTPPHIVEAARATLGRIDLDPASCAAANETVGAPDFFTEAEDGLARAWGSKAAPSRVFLNPPGGVLAGPAGPYDTRSSACAWWRHLLCEHLDGRVSAAVFLAFNLEFLSTAQDPRGVWPSPLAYPVCILSRRLRFSGAASPPHASALVYLGPDPGAFHANFRALGSIVLPHP